MPAPVVFRAGENAKYEAPGEEEFNGNAQELFSIGQSAENNGNRGRAMKAYRRLVKRYPHSSVAAGAQYRLAQLQEEAGDYLHAADSYRFLVERYPQSPNFNEALEAQFRIGEMYLAGKKLKILGIPLVTSMDRAVEIFAAIVRTAPFGKYTARAQFDIGRAREKQGQNDMAVQAYQAVVDKFPNDPLAADAQYQIGYVWFLAAKAGTNDQQAATEARTAFQDFLFRYPRSEKAPQARENIKLLANTQTSNSFEIAKYYDKHKNFRAAAIYYNDVIRQQPGSSQSEEAKKRVDELRARLGDEAVQPRPVNTARANSRMGSAVDTAGRPDYNGPPRPPGARSDTVPSFRGADPNNVAPLPPPESDPSLPPPASLLPDSTGGLDAAPSPAGSPAPEASASPTS
jgi:outer membrane protein assembly factor BamD